MSRMGDAVSAVGDLPVNGQDSEQLLHSKRTSDVDLRVPS